MRARIHDEEWAARAWTALRTEIEPYVAHTETERDWMVSRLAMYWKEGERYTRCLVREGRWEHGEGDAPVPTVRFPGMRAWNDFVNVPLAERPPYNATGDMPATSRKDPAAPVVVVPYRESGHLIRRNNAEILDLAAKAAFVHWLTGEARYARFAADIYWAWLLGTYHMRPPIDLKQGGDGYTPGGILGFYDFEQIHDDLMKTAAPIYDFLHDYLAAHPHPHAAELGQDVTALTGEVFKRFIEIGFVRGGRSGNWNVNGWDILLRGILLLESDSGYADGRGREYYLRHYTTESTPYHQALPEILKEYDAATGLWPEAPGYALSVTQMLLDLAIPIQRAGTDTVGGNPILEKAARALFGWLDPRGNLVVFGDMRGGPANFPIFERLLTYYTEVGDHERAILASTALRQGIEAGHYDRAQSGWLGLCLQRPLLPAATTVPYPRAAWAPAHRHLVMRNGAEPAGSLMFTLYGGTKGWHLTPNGLAVQFYGQGWALSPDASAYESYWSADVRYHQSAAGANTILPGYTEGPVTVHALEPAPPAGEFTTAWAVSPVVSFADLGAAEKRRVVALVRLSPESGYYVDIFRSRQPDNDFLHHNLGDLLELTDGVGAPLALDADASLAPAPSEAYRFFKNIRRAALPGMLTATWTLDRAAPALQMTLRLAGAPNRSVFQVDAPPTSLLPAVSPARTSVAPEATPTLIVRQTGRDGWSSPFVGVFEPHIAGRAAVRGLTDVVTLEDFTVLVVESHAPGASGPIRDLILAATDAATAHTHADVDWQGAFALLRIGPDQAQEIYLGVGHRLAHAGVVLESASAAPVSARLWRDATGVWRCTSDGAVRVTLPGVISPFELPSGEDRLLRP